MASVHQRYRIIDKIDAGGMAEIYRGVAISIEGFEKQVAIKRILPSLCQNQQFVTMFLDEARLTMQLNHANIVQILDIGKVDDTYFIAMELVDGANLRRVMQRALEHNQQVPIAIACYLAMGISDALAYAHEKVDGNGQPLHIVHRDVSPPNVLLSRQGEVKLTDFGMAKATSNAQISDAGVVKGKFAYLSPEVVDGKPADPRADIYSCGIILWELLTGRRLFVGKNDMDTVELVRQGDVQKPSVLRSEIDAELDRLVLRALAKNPKRRFQSAREMEQELASYVFKHNLRATGADLSAFLRELLSEGAAEQVVDIAAVLRAELDEQVRVGRLDPSVGQVPLRSEDLKTRSASAIGLEPLLQRLSAAPLEDLADGGGHALSLAERLEGVKTAAPRGTAAAPSRAKRLVLAVAVLAAVAVAAAWALGVWKP